MNPEDVIGSITWHFFAGNDLLSTSQLQEHEIRGRCQACEKDTIPALVEEGIRNDIKSAQL